MVTIISAGGIIVNDRNEVILVQNKREKWGFPKGHLEEGEDDLTAAKREIHEEAGVSELTLIRKLGLLEHKKPGFKELDANKGTKYISMMLFKSNQKKIGPKDDEIMNAEWIPINEVPEMLNYKVDRDFLVNHLKIIEKAMD